MTNNFIYKNSTFMYILEFKFLTCDNKKIKKTQQRCNCQVELLFLKALPLRSPLPFISLLPTPSLCSFCCLVSSCHSTAIILAGGLVICIYSYPTILSTLSTTALKCQG